MFCQVRVEEQVVICEVDTCITYGGKVVSLDPLSVQLAHPTRPHEFQGEPVIIDLEKHKVVNALDNRLRRDQYKCLFGIPRAIFLKDNKYYMKMEHSIYNTFHLGQLLLIDGVQQVCMGITLSNSMRPLLSVVIFDDSRRLIFQVPECCWKIISSRTKLNEIYMYTGKIG
jgi:hypothetical protein